MTNRVEITNRAQAIAPWEYDSKEGFLTFPDNGYEVNLLEHTDSAKVLDTIIQISKKTWADDAAIAGLVMAFNRIFDPQAHLCSGGANRKVTKEEIARAIGVNR